MKNTHEDSSRFPTPEQISREEALADIKLERMVSEAKGCLESEDLMPFCMEQMDQSSPNGVWNAVKRGVAARRFDYGDGPPQDSNDISKRLTMIRAVEQPTHEA